MQRRRLLQALVIPMLPGGCTAPLGPAPQMVQPPGGAVMAGAAYPPIGAKWKVRVTEASLFHRAADDRDVTATPVDFNGRRGYGLASPTATRVLDPASFNPIGMLEAGKVAVIDSPDTALFSWPLWVGKSWEATNTHADLLYGETWPPAGSETWVAALEDITVPAGTFKAFRIEYQGGIGSSVYDTWRSPGGRPGFESRDTYWYAPGPKMIVKSEVVRLASNYQWAGRTTTELLRMPS